MVCILDALVVKQNCFKDSSPLESGSEQFSKFLDLMGDRIQLLDWDRFRGGLDVKSMTHVHVCYNVLLVIIWDTLVSIS
jgi:hypothetical protein